MPQRSFVISVLVAASALWAAGTAHAQTVTLDGRPVSPVFQRDGRLLVPFRTPMERIGASVTWKSPTAVATVHGQQLVTINMGDSNAILKGNPVYMSAPPQLIGGQPYVAVDALADICGAKISYSANRDAASVAGCTLADMNAAAAAAHPSRGIWLWVLSAAVACLVLWALLGLRVRRPATTQTVTPREIPAPRAIRGSIDGYAARLQSALERMDDARRASFVALLSQTVNERIETLPQAFLTSAKVARDNAVSGSPQTVSLLIERFSDRPELLRDAVKKFDDLHPGELASLTQAYG